MRSGWILLLALAMLAPAAAGASRARFNQLVKDAERHYEEGRYQESAQTLIEAHAIQPHPRLTYNIARAYDQANELELALGYYQRYVDDKKGTDPTLQKRASLSIDRLRGLLAQRAEEQARVEAEARAAREQAELQGAEAKRSEQLALSSGEEARLQRQAATRSRDRTLALALGAVAVGGVGGGTYFGLSAKASKDRFRAAESVEEKQTFESTTRSRALWADVGFGVGLGAAVAAAVLYPWGQQATAPSAAVSVGPGGAGLEVRF